MSMGKWNYRLVTYMYSYKIHFPDGHPLRENPDERLFKVVSVYYDTNDDGAMIPTSWGDSKTDILDGHESLTDLKYTIDKIQEAYNKPILNLDSFPDEYKE